MREGYKYQCYFKADGTLYNGGWTHESVLPKHGPANMLILDDIPSIAAEGFVNIWDGEKIICISKETAPEEGSGEE